MKRNFLLFLAGIFLSLVILELSLRMAGEVFLFIQERANLSSLAQQKEIRILCLGESTTALGEDHSYPRQLEHILNGSLKSKKFSVINKGIPATTTDTIVNDLRENLTQYKPHMVIVMMGINDNAFFLQDKTQTSSLMRWLSSMRTVKLCRWLQDALHYPLNRPIPTALQPTEKANPQNFIDWFELGMSYKVQGLYLQAIDAYKKAFALTTDDKIVYRVMALWKIGECYKSAGLFDQAIEYYQKVLSLVPSHSSAWGELGEIYLIQGKYAQAQKLLTQQILLQPREAGFYRLLVLCYKNQKKYDQIEPLLRHGLDINPNNGDLNAELGYFLMEQKRYKEAEGPFLKVLDLQPYSAHKLNAQIIKQLVIIYNHLALPQKAQAVQERFNYQFDEYKARTWANYSALIGILKEKGIPLIIMQYPLRDLAPLRAHILEKNITYVDNRQPFDQIVTEKGYEYLFTDHFAGDFGHCTNEGNKILAHNAAVAVLKYFNEK